MNATPSLFEGFEDEVDEVPASAPRQKIAPGELRASTAEKLREPGPVGAMTAFGHDLLDACHFARAGVRPLRYEWWRTRLAGQMGDLSAERGWDRWRADLVRYRVPHRLVGPDGLDVEEGGEVAIALDVQLAARRAWRLLVAAAAVRVAVHFPMEAVTLQEEDGGVMFGGVSWAEAEASARKIKRAMVRAAIRRVQAERVALESFASRRGSR